jgi:hypothetical protein
LLGENSSDDDSDDLLLGVRLRVDYEVAVRGRCERGCRLVVVATQKRRITRQAPGRVRPGAPKRLLV